MKRAWIFFSVILLVAAFAGTAPAETNTPRWVGDVPVMPEMKLEPELGFAFDSADGRIVVIYMSGDVAAERLAAYYREALPPLGWRQTAAMRWHNDDETFSINRTSVAGQTLWKIAVSPR